MKDLLWERCITGGPYYNWSFYGKMLIEVVDDVRPSPHWLVRCEINGHGCLALPKC